MEILYGGKKTYEHLYQMLFVWALVFVPVLTIGLLLDGAFLASLVVIATIFMGMCVAVGAFFVWGSRALSHKHVALHIDADGIRLFPENKNSRVLVSFVGWGDVTDVKFAPNAGHNTIAIILKNPMALIQHQNSAMVRRILQTQLEQSGSPVLLHTNQYEIAPDELLQKLQKQLKNFNKNKRSKK